MARNEKSVTNDLSAGVSTREHPWANVRMAYQPVHHVLCRQPAGAEALLRRLEPDGSVLGPQSVLEQADRDGTDFELACYIVSLAAQQAKTWAGDNWLTGYLSASTSALKSWGEQTLQQAFCTSLNSMSAIPETSWSN